MQVRRGSVWRDRKNPDRVVGVYRVCRSKCSRGLGNELPHAHVITNSGKLLVPPLERFSEDGVYAAAEKGSFGAAP